MFVRNGLLNITGKCSALTHDSSQIGLAKLLSLLFLSFCNNCFYVLIEFY